MKTSLKYILIAILIALGVFFFSHTKPVEPGRYMDIQTYIKQNISTLSPVKASLGGTFYVTAIETNDGTGTVSYEDGHNAHTADFTYTNERGKSTITSFTVRE